MPELQSPCHNVGLFWHNHSAYVFRTPLVTLPSPGLAMLEGITWFRQSSVRIRRSGIELHIDPWGVSEQSVADYILLTHPHYDNFSEDDIARVREPDTIVIAPASMRKQLADVDHLMRPGDMIHLDGIEILAVPAYNRVKKFHPPPPRTPGWDTYLPWTALRTITPAIRISSTP